MAKMEDKSQLERLEADREVAWSPNPADRGAPRRWRQRILALLITVAAVALAVVLSRETWHAYMETPWTRDGTVRVYVVTMAPRSRVASSRYKWSSISSCTKTSY
jgi:ferric-dicitrate binding protein FerR (iron transport regulator)